MTVLYDDRRRTAHHIVSEAANIYRSREQIVIASGSGKLVAGTVLAKVTASGKYVPWASGGAGGAGDSVAVLWGPVDATSADAEAVANVRDCEVAANLLTWPAGTSDAAKNAELVKLDGRGIIAR